MSEEIITALMQIKKLHVAARTSSFSFKGKHLDLRVIGEQLNVRTVLEGSVRKVGNHLRITAQLVNATDGYHLWAEKYDREMKDIFEVQEDIARSIAQRLEVMLEGAPEPLMRVGTEDVEAFRLLQQGRSHFFQRGPRLVRALEFYKQAVAQDPNYAMAWSSLADAYNLVGFYGLLRPEACVRQAKEAAQRAVTLNDSMAETHNSLALSYLFNDWDRTKAEREFLLALDISARYSLARLWYSLFFLEWAEGRCDEGLAHAKQAVESDPFSGWARGVLAFSYVNAGDPDGTMKTAEATLQIEPESFIARWAMLTALNAKRRFVEAAEYGGSVLGVTGRSPWMMASLARTYRELGKPADSEALYMELKWRAKREYVQPCVLGWAASAAGEKDEAIEFAQEAHAVGDPMMIAAKYWPDFALLRQDPRFDVILVSHGWT